MNVVAIPAQRDAVANLESSPASRNGQRTTTSKPGSSWTRYLIGLAEIDASRPLRLRRRIRRFSVADADAGAPASASRRPLGPLRQRHAGSGMRVPSSSDPDPRSSTFTR